MRPPRSSASNSTPHGPRRRLPSSPTTPNVRVLCGNWTELRDHGPFDLLVLDGGGKGKEPDEDPPLEPNSDWLAIDGAVVLDDFTPTGAAGEQLHDIARQYWLQHPALQATEIRLSPSLATLVGMRVR